MNVLGDRSLIAMTLWLKIGNIIHPSRNRKLSLSPDSNYPKMSKVPGNQKRVLAVANLTLSFYVFPHTLRIIEPR